MVKKLYMASTPTFVVDLMNELVEKFCRCHKWSGRQTFVFICQVKCLFIYILGGLGGVGWFVCCLSGFCFCLGAGGDQN